MNVYSQWFDVLRVGNNYNTMQYFAGTGGDTFEINFAGGYLDKSHVKAVADDEGPSISVTFLTKSRVKLSRVIPVGSNVLIFRDTPKVEPLALFSDGAIINSVNMDRNAKQAIFVAAEMLDRFDTFGSSLETSVSQVSEALETANKALSIATGIDGKASDALAKAAEALSRASSAEDVAEDASEVAYKVRNDLVSGSGSGIVGHGTTTVGAELTRLAAGMVTAEDKLNQLGYECSRLALSSTGDCMSFRIVHKIDHEFPGYQNVLAANGYSWMYATGHTYDRLTEELWIAYQANGGDNATFYVVYDLNTMAMKTYFKAGERWTKSFSIHYIGSSRFLYSRGVGDFLVKFDITTLPTAGANLPEIAGPKANVQPLFCAGLGDEILVSYRGVTTNAVTYSNQFRLLDRVTWEQRGSYRLPTVLAGDESGGGDGNLYKTQGIVPIPGGLAIAYGGFVAGSSVLSMDDRRLHQGIALVDPEGSVVKSCMMNPYRMMPALRSRGLKVNRIETEGINYDTHTGSLTTLWHTDGEPGSKFIIVEAFSRHPDSFRMDGAAISLSPVVRDVESLYRNHTDGGTCSDPITGAVLNDVSDVCDMMVRWDMRKLFWYSTNFGSMKMGGEAIPGSMDCELTRGTNTTFYLTMFSTGGFKQYLVVKGAGGYTFTLMRTIS